jgi:polyhydroxyalkanoate synthesis regulator protein
MSTKVESDVMQVLDTAVNAFGDAMKAGVKAQEEMSKWWSDALSNGNPLADWQKRTRQLFDDAVPTAQRHTQELLKLVEQNYRRSVELLKRALNMDHSGAVDGLQEKIRELWEESVSVVKENTEAMAQVNVKILEAWTDLMRKNFEQGEAAIRSAAAAAKAAPK